MRRAPLGFFALALTALLAGSCLGPDASTGVGETARAQIAINPAIIASPGNATARSIQRVRVVVTRAADAVVLAQSSFDVDSASASWTLSLAVNLTTSPVDAMLTVYLIHVAGGTESVEFSGLVGPLTLTSGAPALQPDVPLVRGPLSNLYTTGVVLTAPDTVLEAVPTSLSATATTSATTPPTVFWTVLDTTVLSMSGSVVTGRVPGTGRVVASAGAYADTASIVVRAAPTTVRVRPDTVFVGSVGGQASFSAVVTDVRGDTLRNEPVLWRSLTGSVATSLGGGTFQAVGIGTSVVEAYPPARPAVIGRGVVVVAGAPPANLDLRIQKSVDQPQPLAGSRITFTVSARNLGPARATNVAIFDTLRTSAFTSPTHGVSLGSLVGDSLWTIPQLDSGVTATWTTSVTVASGVAGGSATNVALLRSLTQSDTNPANDTARVSINFPLSAVPTVVITDPPDSSVYDPGDPVTFVASATDPEDGDLTANIVWTSSLDGSLATGRTFTTSALRAGVHTIVASATDSHGGVGTDTIRVTIALYTMPTTLNVPFGGTASLPITLSQPAPTGGVTLTVVSSAPAVTAPLSSTVFIPSGALSANATLQGLLPGTANITVGNPQFGYGVVIASVTAQLNILQSSLSFATPFPQTITVQFESQGTPRAAPTGGLSVSLTSTDPACVAVASPTTIPGGQTSRTATLTYGGTATPPCQAYVRATSTGIVPDSVFVSVTPAPTISMSATTVAAGLQASTGGSLGASNHGGVTLTLTSSDSTRLLLSPNSTTPGSRSLSINMPNGTSGYSFYVQGVEGATGTATVSAVATGFTSGGATMTVVQPGVILANLPSTTTSLSPNSLIYAYVGVPAGNSVSVQNVRAGSPGVVATFAIDSLSVGQLTNGTITGDTVTATIQPGLYYTPTSLATGGVYFDPIGVGTATVTARIPGFVTQTQATGQVTVTAPTISMSATTVAAGLQTSTGGSLGASNHGGVTLTLTSSDSTRLLLSPNSTTPGTRSLSINMPNGTSGYSFYVQGVEGTTGTASVSAVATGFVSGGATMTVVQPGVILASLPSTTTSLSPNSLIYAYVGIPSGNSVSVQNVRAGSPGVVATFAIDSLSVGQLTNGTITGDTVTATIQPGLYYTPTSLATGGVYFDPIGVGTATVTARIPGFVTQTQATGQVTVTAPTISMSATTVAAGLQTSTGGSLGATNHGGVTLTLTSSDPTRLLLSPNSTTPGTGSLNINMPNGTSGYSFYVQGVEGTTGTASVSAVATGFVSGGATMTVVQPGVILASLPSTTTTLSPNNLIYTYVGIPSGNSVSVQNVRAGSPGVVATFVIDNTGVGLLTNGTITGSTVTATIQPGLYYTPTSVAAGGVEFDPIGVGTANVSTSIPGFVTQPQATGQVTVSAPAITMSPVTVGAGLQTSSGGSLGASNHGGVTLTLTSSDPSTVLISPNSTTAGTGSINLNIPNGSSGYSFYVQGVVGATGTATVTATAAGFLDGSAAMTVVQPGIILASVPASVASGAANQLFYAYVGVPSGNSVSVQNVSAGTSGVVVTATSSNVAAAQLVTQAVSGASVTATIVPGLYYTPTSLAGGGLYLDPVAAGQTTIGVSASGFIQQPLATQVVTVTP